MHVTLPATMKNMTLPSAPSHSYKRNAEGIEELKASKEKESIILKNMENNWDLCQKATERKPRQKVRLYLSAPNRLQEYINNMTLL